MAQTDIIALLGNIIEIIVSGITSIAGGIGEGLSALAASIFLASGGLSVFGALILIFAGISLAFGLCRWVLNFITSLGNRNR